MQSLYLLLFLVIVASVTTPSSLNNVFGQQGMQSATTPTEQQQQPIIELSGQQYFANGTGIMYFSDNTTSGIIVDSIIEPGDSASVVFSSPGGFHFNDAFNENATGTLIVEEE